MTPQRLDQINTGGPPPTALERRSVTYNTSIEAWQIKTARHRSYCQNRRHKNRIARASRRANRSA